MFRWLLLALLLLSSACRCGADDDSTLIVTKDQQSKDQKAKARPKAKGKIPHRRVKSKPTKKQAEKIKELEAIGYLAEVEEEPPPSDKVIVRHNQEKAYAGLNFYISAHAPAAILMDMEGSVLHTWMTDFDTVWPDNDTEADHNGRRSFRRGALLKNGDVLGIFEGLGIVRLDKSSKLKWAALNRAHHDLFVNGDEVYVLVREAHMVPRIDAEEPIAEDFVAVLDLATGKEKERHSILEAYEKYPEFNAVMSEKGVKKAADIFHTNSLEVLDGRFADQLPMLAAGNLLLSARNLDTIQVFDWQKKAITWSYHGGFARQHDPKLLENGNMLLFDNSKGKFSRVLELNPKTLETVWEFAGNEERVFRSSACGAAQRLPNGNTLVTESGRGRAFELDGNDELVWVFRTPHKTERDGEKKMARLYEVIRLET
ncbi:MAG: hypothetical protein HN348_10720, partial [Proteobacteria bacterium]|nr:hypothetical protein [Pseudomonadota bacterium]